ncbi:hypothetical protein R3W88_031118 [Solanum pinnatisectum]|uniref:F-box/LRR-repeat protein 15/At3g58940/PEG3-like LRR domain-containing protein n=1 Tax=Solanum pinnatisectum TaxID=50273 RepID=A0AAV9LKG0_9SOLN|nr:hypothetical protein R3W88_031118 [Solanum pinnatisectum]
MRIISKTWLQAWDEKISLNKFEFSNCSKTISSGQIFLRIDKWLDMANHKGVKNIVYEEPHDRLIRSSYCFPIIKVLAAKSLRELVLCGYDLMHVSLLSSGAAYSHSLRKLSLSHLKLDDNMLQTLLNSCPSIVSSVLKHCWGLKNIELLNLQKIKSITITAIGNVHAKIQAPTLEHLSYSGCGSKILDIDECQKSEIFRAIKCENI